MMVIIGGASLALSEYADGRFGRPAGIPVRYIAGLSSGLVVLALVLVVLPNGQAVQTPDIEKTLMTKNSERMSESQ